MGTEVVPAEENIEKPSDVELKIIRQIEYYFGNYNLGRDKFLKEEIKKNDGWIPLETMVRFQRLKQLSEDFSTISDALKKSPNQLMEVNEDCTKIRRKTPLPENVDKDEIENRSLYVKGFKKDTTLDEILDFFKEHKVENVMMRRKKQKDKFFFKGSVFATFETLSDCDTFLEKKGLKFDKMEMIKERKKDYMKRKDEFYDNLRAEKEKKKVIEKERTFPKGCLLKLVGVNSESVEKEKAVKREEIKKVLEEFGKIAFVDYFQGNADAIIRFEEGIVSEVLTKAEEEDGQKKIKIGLAMATLQLIEGEEETKYWEMIKNHGPRPRGNQRFKNKNQFNKKNRNNRSWGRKRNNDNDQEKEVEPPTKKVKIETDNGKEDSSKEVEVKSESME